MLRPCKTSVRLNNAVRHADIAAIERAVTNDPQVCDVADELYKTALMTASAEGQTDALDLLLNKG